MAKDLPATENSFGVSERNRVKRAHERGSYNHESVHAVLDAAILCHVAYVIDGQPFCTPTIHWREGNVLYWHGSSASRMLRNQKEGARVCLTVSHLDGLVMASSGFNHSANYRSAMCFGKAALVNDRDHKEKALLAMIERYFPARNDVLLPFSESDLKATSVVFMEIEEASSKVRAKGVGDEPAGEEYPAWRGVIPVKTIIGAGEADEQNYANAAMSGVDIYSEGKSLDAVLASLVK